MLPVLTNIFWCKKNPKKQTRWPLRFVCTPVLIWTLVHFQPRSGLCRCHAVLVMYSHVVEIIFFYHGKTCRFQLDQRTFCRNVFRKRKKTPRCCFESICWFSWKSRHRKVHKQAICEKFNNSSKLGKWTVLTLKKILCFEHSSTQWCEKDKQKVFISTPESQNRLSQKMKEKAW